MTPTEAPLRILLLSHYFPPEVNAPAARTYEHARLWVEAGHEVHVITCCPSHPGGVPFPGHARGWYRAEMMGGVAVHRVWTILAPNRGTLRRSLSFLSYVPTAVWRALRLGRFDVLVATSPQLFCPLTADIVGRLRRVPWIFELRDLWPDSIRAVGAMRSRALLGLLKRLERYLYRRARAVVCLTRTFIDEVAAKGIERGKLYYVPNAVLATAGRAERESARRELEVPAEDLLVTYVGTVGMAHGLATLLDAAALTGRRFPRARFLIAGDGARLGALSERAAAEELPNVRFLGLLSRKRARQLLLASDVNLVMLRRRAVFRTVLPSKLLEAMAAGVPVVLAVEGEAKRILEAAGAGVAVPPEDPAALAAAIERLAEDAEERRRMGEAGRSYVEREFDRRVWAARYLELLRRIAAAAPEAPTSSDV